MQKERLCIVGDLTICPLFGFSYRQCVISPFLSCCVASSLILPVGFVLFCFFKAWVANFERPRMNANSLLASPTGLSPYLRFGCLSCRLFYFKLTDLYKKVGLLCSQICIVRCRGFPLLLLTKCFSLMMIFR